MSDCQGIPITATLSQGQRHDSVSFEKTMEAVCIRRRRGRPLQRPKALTADMAYSSKAIRNWLRKRGIKAAIPETKRQKGQRKKRGHRPIFCDPQLYKKRVFIEHAFSFLKESRRIATRYEKTANNFLAMVHIAIARRLLRLLTR